MSPSDISKAPEEKKEHLNGNDTGFLTDTAFSSFDLPKEIITALDEIDFNYCTPIQKMSIPVALENHDLAGQAQTGTGKTTAFLVPLFTKLLKQEPKKKNVPRAIIILPTRELAMQVHEDALLLAKHTKIKQVLVIGGIDYQEQADLLGKAPELIICTPGRIIDYLQQKIFDPSGIEVVVIDEADRLLDMGFIKDLRYLLSKMPHFSQRQTMLFSATLDYRVLELTYEFMNPPKVLKVEEDTDSNPEIEQFLYHISKEDKLRLLLSLLKNDEHQRIIIFVNTRSGVEWLAHKLSLNGFAAQGITGDLPQLKRLKLMEDFKEDRLKILVATDVASRGIHVDDVSHVYNYDLPQDPENYIHRIGRTARAGQTGKAISLACEDYVFHLEAIEDLLTEKIPVVWPQEDFFIEAKDVVINDPKARHARKKSTPASKKSDSTIKKVDATSEAEVQETEVREDKRQVSNRRGGGKHDGSRQRGVTQTSRPGGIFGLSPRNPFTGEETRAITASGADLFSLLDAKVNDKPKEDKNISVTGNAQKEPSKKTKPKKVVPKKVVPKKLETTAVKEGEQNEPSKKAETVAVKKDEQKEPSKKAETVAVKEDEQKEPNKKAETVAVKKDEQKEPSKKAETVAVKEDEQKEPNKKAETVAVKKDEQKEPSKKAETVAVKKDEQKEASKKDEPKKVLPKKAIPKKTAPKKLETVAVKKDEQKEASKKDEPKKVLPKKAIPKKTAPKKLETVAVKKDEQKEASKKDEPKKVLPKKAIPKKTAPKKLETVAVKKDEQKEASKKDEPKKVLPKKAIPKKTAPKKLETTAVKKDEQKEASKKDEPKKVLPKKAIPKKTAPKKLETTAVKENEQKEASKKDVPKKAVPKKAIPKKTAPKKLETTAVKKDEQKEASKKDEPKKVLPKKAIPKKTAPKKLDATAVKKDEQKEASKKTPPKKTATKEETANKELKKD